MANLTTQETPHSSEDLDVFDRLETLARGGDQFHTGQNSKFVQQNVEGLVRSAVLGDHDHVVRCHRIIWGLAQSAGIYPASIDALYKAFAESNDDFDFTVPAVNMRAVAFYSAQGVFRAMKSLDAKAVIFELSRGEIGFTGQRPHEYAACILGAAIAEGHTGPVFLQGDHFQISASRYAKSPDEELEALKSLIAEAISAGFYNIDIDASTIGDGGLEDVKERLYPNARHTAELVSFARSLQPRGVEFSLGGEIGEIGEANSTPEEVQIYLSDVNELLPKGVNGLSNLSVQTGTRHGGNILADGTVGDMPIDFDLIKDISRICRREFGLGGCVQHGASLLSHEKLKQLPDAGCIEVHLAASFLNAVYAGLPENVVRDADEWIVENFRHEWKAHWSEAQFLHHGRRYPVGPFKKSWWAQKEALPAITENVECLATELFASLGNAGTSGIVTQHVRAGPNAWRSPAADKRQRPNDEGAIDDLAS